MACHWQYGIIMYMIQLSCWITTQMRLFRVCVWFLSVGLIYQAAYGWIFSLIISTSVYTENLVFMKILPFREPPPLKVHILVVLLSVCKWVHKRTN